MFLKMTGPDVLVLLIQFLFLFQGMMEYVFELDVSGKVEDICGDTASGKSSALLRYSLANFLKRISCSYISRNLNPFYKSE